MSFLTKLTRYCDPNWFSVGICIREWNNIPSALIVDEIMIRHDNELLLRHLIRLHNALVRRADADNIPLVARNAVAKVGRTLMNRGFIQWDNELDANAQQSWIRHPGRPV
jgi:hypothetical protein